MKTPYELGNGNQTTTWAECIAFYERLASEHPGVLRFETAGETDIGEPLHVGVISADGVFDRQAIQAAGRTVFFLDNGIHPGEPEGIDATMMLVRDLCEDPQRLDALGSTVLVFVPIYNVDGALKRNDTSRVNQEGPEAFGFRGNARHLDLNRDFVKCDSRNARSFNQLFSAWDPDVFVDTHTSNGADYQHVMTLIATQPDKLGGPLGAFLRERMLPHLYEEMTARGFPMCPYINTRKEIPDDGIEDFLDTPRFSTGYAALHHVIGFMPETHMLKPFGERLASMRHLVEAALAFTVAHGQEIRGLKAETRAADRKRRTFPVQWRLDETRHRTFRLKGFEARWEPSRLGTYQRLRYDRSAPFEKAIAWFDRFVPAAEIGAPAAYVIPQAWREVVERLRLNGVHVKTVAEAKTLEVEAYRVLRYHPRSHPFEGRHLHDELELATERLRYEARAGDFLVPVDQDRARYVIETLEPIAHDSFFRWGFFDAVLHRKERFSDYVFEDVAEELLETEPGLRERFEAWKRENPALLDSSEHVLGFLYENCRRYAEPEWMRVPVFRLPRA
ncbi:M14 family zinc carboxypeptidase [Vulgatibacter sp.]|uniref:M14 family zinc carboxypeptidase n=1 Tax=Vulgatibacter sp. TaxID=1971226 RepID=UPI003568F5EE